MSDFNFDNSPGGKLFSPTKPLELVPLDNQKSKDSAFLGGVIEELFTVAGVPCYVYLYQGVFDQTKDDGSDELLSEIMNFKEGDDLLAVQDSTLGENRDRKYSEDAVRLKGIYAVSENELDFARFGLLISNDIMQIEFHKEDMERKLGRRLIPGDVVEMPHLRETGIDGRVTNRFYSVENVVRAPASFDHTYNYHVLAATMTPMRDAQEFIDIMEREDKYGKTLSEQAGNRQQQLQTTAHVQDQANDAAYTTWFDTTSLWVTDEGKVQPIPWWDDGRPPNGQKANTSSEFPSDPEDGDYIIRVDFFPNRLYRFNEDRDKWELKEYDNKRQWQPYSWLPKQREHMSDGSHTDQVRPFELKSIHEVRGPRQGSSEPSIPNSDHYRHIVLRNWTPINDDYDFPEEPHSDIVSRISTLVATNTPSYIGVGLDTKLGQYRLIVVRYVFERNSFTRRGELYINDDGTIAHLDDEYTETGDTGLEFSVSIDGSVRKLLYTLTSGDDGDLSYEIVVRQF